MPSSSLIAQGFSPRIVQPERRVGLPLIVGEAPGKTEDDTGIPFHPEAEAGGLFARLMERVGVKRERFSIANCVWQRPPYNELYDEDGNPKAYTREAIDYWKPSLHQLIEELKPPVIIGLGRTALEVLTGFSDIGTTRGYVNSARVEVESAEPQRIQCCDGSGGGCPCCDGEGYFETTGTTKIDLNIPTICTYHPQFLNYGNRYLSGVFIRDVLEGLEIGQKGWHPPKLRVVPNPTVGEFEMFCSWYDPTRHKLTYDIETPDSSDLPEDELTDNGKEISGEIVRASFCYDTAVGGYSIPWQEPFISMARALLGTRGAKVSWNGRLFDRPRLARYGCVVAGREYDLLDRWRHLHRTLPASLAFVAPFYLNISPWKHEAHSQPEYYSAMDAIVEHLVAEGTERDLRATGQWEVYERHVVDVLALTERMSKNGLPYDSEKAKAFELELEGKQKERLGRLHELVPVELLVCDPPNGYKTLPKKIKAMTVVGSNTNIRGFVLRNKKKGKSGNAEGREAWYTLMELPFLIPFEKGTKAERDWCAKVGADKLRVTRWSKRFDFNPSSPVQVKMLIKHFGHKPKTDRKSKEESTGDTTLKSLITSHLDSTKASDLVAVECYQIIRECRAISKVLGTYVKGWKPASDGLIHATPGIWGDMFRISWRKPNLAATVADKKEIQIAAGFRKCIAVPEDQIIIESDWRGMEAVLVAHFAKDADYMRLARLGPHSYLASHVLNRPAELSWSNSDLYHYFKEIKENNQKVYDDCKHIVHGISYGMTAYLAAELYEMSRARAQQLINLFFALFPKVKKWQQSVIQEAHEKTKLINAWGYRMFIWDAYTWKQTKYDRLRKLWVRWNTEVGKATPPTAREVAQAQKIGELIAEGLAPEAAIASLSYELGAEAKSALSFYPRDTGAAMLKDTMLALEEEYGLVSCRAQRVCSHDAILHITSLRKGEEVAAQVKGVMERPWPQLDNLVIRVEQKFGRSWDREHMLSRFPCLALEAYA